MSEQKFYTKYGKHYKTTSFDIPKEKIFITLQGKKVNLYDRIQAANIDVDIYETLEKYNMAPTLANCEEILEKRPLLYADISRIQEFEHPQDAIDYANKQWQMLPLKVRNEFGNDIRRFMQEGEQWAETKAKPFYQKYLAEMEALKEQQKPSEVTKDEQK